MKIFQSMRSGFSRAAGSWEGILVTWIISLMLAAMIAVPLKAILKTGFGSSMITERFLHGINIETFTDLGPLFRGFVRSFGSGILILFLISFISNAFLTGGLFQNVSLQPGNRSFWQSCATNFRSFLVVQAIMSIFIFFLHATITGVPTLVISFGDAQSEKAVFLVVLISSIVFFLVLPVFIIVADYARAYLVQDAGTGSFRAIGFGFRQTFSNLKTSWILMLFLVVIQVIYLVLCFVILSGIIPSTGNGVFLFFILSQLLFAGRIFLRVVRYGSVTMLMELSTESSIHGNHTHDYDSGLM